jgi:aminoglycoside 3-N-acetyltransferase
MAVEREAQIIAQTEFVITQQSLAEDFKTLGVMPGSVVLLHSSLSKLGWVCGGAVAVILALEEVLSENGTLVMPTHSGDNSDPAKWENPPVPKSWIETIRDQMPAFDPFLTPTRGMGRIPEIFRAQSGVLRSDHPAFSFAAKGLYAKEITSGHKIEFDLGNGSPLEKVYNLDGWILLLGVGHGNNTSLHLAEYRAEYPGKKMLSNGCSACVDGKKQWIEYPSLNLDESDFTKIGTAYEQQFPEAVIRGKVGMADVLLIRQKPLVDYAVNWMKENRDVS